MHAWTQGTPRAGMGGNGHLRRKPRETIRLRSTLEGMRLSPLPCRFAAVVLAASAIALSGCASNPAAAPASFGSLPAPPPEGAVVGQGTVMDIAGAVELCLGPVAESYPPQCSGIELVDWTWDGVDGSEQEGDVRWGAYAVQGTYDGELLTVTQPPIMLALYDPMPVPDPTEGRPGVAANDEEMRDLQDELPERLGSDYLSSTVENGYLWIDVVWDDGTMQDAADAEFGADTVVVRSALREVEG